MILRTFLTTCSKKLILFIQIQLFITLISLPLLCWWGIPVSLLSILGNLLFAPVLSVFLLISSLIMFCYLLNIPYSILVYSLNGISDIWLKILTHAPKGVLFTLPQPPVWWICLLPYCTVLCVTQTRTRIKSILALSLIACAFIGYLKIFYSPTETHLAINCGTKKVHVFLINKQLSIIDPGSTNRLGTPSSWVDYTLTQELAKKIGTLAIDHYIILKPSIRSLQVAQHLAKKSLVKSFYVPYWEKDTHTKLAYHFINLKKGCTEKKIKLHRFGKKGYTIDLDQTSSIALKAIKNKNYGYEISINGNAYAYQ